MGLNWIFFTLDLNVLTSFWINEPFAKPKIDNMNLILFLAYTNQEIIWLNVSVNQALFMQILEQSNTLKSNFRYCPLCE